MMRARAYFLTAVAATLIASAPAEARKKQPEPVAPPPVVQVALPSSPNALTVRYYYERRQYPAIWFGAKGGDEAIGQLLSVLRRAPIDGMADGPATAARVEATVQAARASNDPMQIKAAELALSAAWVDYVQAIRRPGREMHYGDPALAANVPVPDRTLALAEAAPSLAQHLLSVSTINPIYAQLREAALKDAAANGGHASDKLLVNLERARILPSSGKFILVNVAEQKLHMYDNWQETGSMKVVVGKGYDPLYKSALQTPFVASTIYYAVLNPYWHVPEHLIRKFAPAIAKEGDAYMKKRGYQVISDFSEHPQILPTSSVDWKAVAASSSTNVIIRQLPNVLNSMGRMKFPFPNPQGIYLHDSPEKEYFSLADRAKSNGCVRVEDYRKLANWLFNGNAPVANGTDPEQHVPLPRGVPVYVTYLTLVPSSTGMTEFADKYQRDSVMGALAGVSAQGISASGSAN
jgi:murein L,D-transpeptidase YcbB/YkuD